MNWTEFLVETAATAVESWAVISAVTEICGRRLPARRHHIAVIGFALVLTAVISVLNPLRIVSFFTSLISILSVFFLTGLISESPWLFRMFSALLVYLAVISADYIVLFAFDILGGTKVTSTTYFSRFMDFGPLRCWFLFTCRGIDLLLYLALKKQLPKLQRIHRGFLVVLTAVLLFAHMVTPAIMSMVWSDLIFALQMALICSWLIALVCVGTALCFSVLTSKYQDEKSRNDLLNICNSMMEENYQRLYSNQQATARLVHDFNHHMGVLRDLSRQHGDEEIYGYVDSLLKTNYKELPMCKTGNNIINAIINCKIGEAAEHDIRFSYNIEAEVPPSLPPADLCAILANQIDNAFDACKNIREASQRSVDVRIWQNSDDLFLFQVSNSTAADPLVKNPQLKSTKSDLSTIHGLGIKSIRDTAEKYGGALENSYQGGRFFSTVFLELGG